MKIQYYKKVYINDMETMALWTAEIVVGKHDNTCLITFQIFVMGGVTVYMYVLEWCVLPTWYCS